MCACACAANRVCTHVCCERRTDLWPHAQMLRAMAGTEPPQGPPAAVLLPPETAPGGAEGPETGLGPASAAHGARKFSNEQVCVALRIALTPGPMQRPACARPQGNLSTLQHTRPIQRTRARDNTHACAVFSGRPHHPPAHVAHPGPSGVPGAGPCAVRGVCGWSGEGLHSCRRVQCIQRLLCMCACMHAYPHITPTHTRTRCSRRARTPLGVRGRAPEGEGAPAWLLQPSA